MHVSAPLLTALLCIRFSPYKVRIRFFAYQLLVLTLPRTRFSIYYNRTGSSTYQRLRSVSIPLHTIYVSAPLLLCVLFVLYTRCVLASVFAYCLNYLPYQLFVLIFLHIKSSVYCVRTGSSAYQLLYVSAPPHTVYVSAPLLCTVYVLYMYQLLYVSAPLHISSSIYQLPRKPFTY